MSTLRIIGGTAARRKLQSPRRATIRPTTDRVKETLFNLLGASVIEARFLDLYAGSGSVGLEALSRGASAVTLVDHSAAALRSIRSNLETLGLTGARVVRARLPGGLPSAAAADAPFDLVFLDPPYGTDLIARTLAVFREHPELVAPHGRLLVQHETQRPLAASLVGYRQLRQRVVGSTTLTFLSFSEFAAPGK